MFRPPEYTFLHLKRQNITLIIIIILVQARCWVLMAKIKHGGDGRPL